MQCKLCDICSDKEKLVISQRIVYLGNQKIIQFVREHYRKYLGASFAGQRNGLNQPLV
jgi:hypothetical protein